MGNTPSGNEKESYLTTQNAIPRSRSTNFEDRVWETLTTSLANLPNFENRISIEVKKKKTLKNFFF